MTAHKKRIKILTVLAAVLTAAVITLGLLWNHYLNKNNLLAKFESPQGQEVYILGTFHSEHFNRWLNYSLADILSAVKNVRPDVVFIEAREEIFKEYGVIDGPVDMSVVYAYCVENAIPAELIDWWVVDNEFQSNSTNDKRDDMIFANIDAKLKAAGARVKVLIVCGGAHYHEQSERFTRNGFIKQAMKNTPDYFDSGGVPFQYPAAAQEIWEQRAYFYAYTFRDLIRQDAALNDKTKAEWTGGNFDEYYNQQLAYCEMFANHELYK